MLRVIQSVLTGDVKKEEILKENQEQEEKVRRRDEEYSLKTEIIVKPIFVNKKTYDEIEYDNELEFVVDTLRKWFKNYHIDVDTINEDGTITPLINIYESEKKGIFKIEGINGEYRRFVNIIYCIREDNALYVDYEYDGSENINISNEKENSYLKFQILSSTL